ncbi:hypothetical protein [Streptomyces sp. NPDC002990]
MNDSDRTHGTAIKDTHFGAITVRQDGQDRIEVAGEGIPRVVLERDPESDTDPQTAIGTRDPARLTLRIDGREVALIPGKGRLSRRSYRVDVEYEGARYRLVPDSVPSSRLTRDGVHLGDFSCDGDEMVIADWKEHAPLRPADASIGYTLASAFGTGGQPLWMTLADTISTALP